MDSPPALGGCSARGGHCICHGCAPQSWPAWIDNRGTHLDDEYRHHRKRPVNRDRSTLCFPMRSGDHLLAKLLDSNEIRMAHLDSGIHFSWAWPPHERSNTSGIFLRDRASRLMADEARSCFWLGNRGAVSRREPSARCGSSIHDAGPGSGLVVAGNELCLRCAALASRNGGRKRTNLG